jgi:hypothetical protein
MRVLLVYLAFVNGDAAAIKPQGFDAIPQLFAWLTVGQKL